MEKKLFNEPITIQSSRNLDSSRFGELGTKFGHSKLVTP